MSEETKKPKITYFQEQSKGAVTIEQIAKKVTVVDKEVAEEIVTTQFEFVRSCIQKGKFDTIKLILLGKFLCKPGRLKVLRLTKDEERTLDDPRREV